jgi:hypothetical protein
VGVQQEGEFSFLHRGRPEAPTIASRQRRSKNGFAGRLPWKSVGIGADLRLLGVMSPPRVLLLLLVSATAVAGGWWTYGWMSKKSPLEPRGGLWFPRTVLNDVPHFAQADTRWSKDKLGPTPGSLGAEGCAVASAAMVLAAYGADLDPGRLNAFLKTNGGYTDRGWLYWEKAAEYPPVVARHVYEDDASHFLIDWNVMQGNPVIVRLRYPDGITHFVVIVGKSGHEYLIRDPGRRFSDGIYPLSEFGSPIEALRYYESLPAAFNPPSPAGSPP